MHVQVTAVGGSNVLGGIGNDYKYATRYEQTSAKLGYAGSWTTADSPGSHAYVNVSGALVTIKFSGSDVAWITKKSPAYGKAKVTLDGVDQGNIDLYNAEPALAAEGVGEELRHLRQPYAYHRVHRSEDPFGHRHLYRGGRLRHRRHLDKPLIGWLLRVAVGGDTGFEQRAVRSQSASHWPNVVMPVGVSRPSASSRGHGTRRFRSANWMPEVQPRKPP